MSLAATRARLMPSGRYGGLVYLPVTAENDFRARTSQTAHRSDLPVLSQ